MMVIAVIIASFWKDYVELEMFYVSMREVDSWANTPVKIKRTAYLRMSI